MFTTHGYDMIMINEFVQQHFSIQSISTVFAMYQNDPGIVERVATQFLAVVGGQQ